MSETIDLTNYPIIAQNQGKSCEVTEIVALHGIDLAKTGYSLLLTTLTSISTTVQVVGQNMLGYTGFAVINDEIVQVNSSVAIGDNTSLSISRAMNGTVAQTLSVIDKDYIFPVNLFFVDTFNYKSKTDLNESDLFGISLDNGRVIIADDIQNWQPYSSSRLYNSYINKRVFLFRGVNGQFIKDYEGVTTNYTLRDYGEVEITISDSVATVYNEPLNSNKLFTDMYPKEMMEIMFPEYKVQYVADTNEAHYPKIKDLTLGEFDKYSDFLQYICKKYALRIIFRKNNTIFIFSDIQQESIIPTETITPTNLVSITNNSDGRLVINKAEGSYIQRKDYVNEEDYDNNNKYVKFFYYKDFVGSYTILKNTEVTPSVFEKIWQELTFSMTADELKHITYDDYVLIVLQDGREFICKPSDINVNTSTLKVMCGYDKARYFDYYGRLDSLSEITATNLRLYYAPSSKPVISKYTRNIGGEDKDSNLQYPIIAGEEEIIYLNYGAVTTNDSTFSGIVKGNIVTNTFIDNTKLLYGKEYAQNLLDCPLYLYSNKIDTSSTDYIKVNSFDNSNIQVKTEWSDDKNQHLKVTFKNTLSGAVTSYTPLSVTNNFVKVDLATYNAININATLKLSIVPTSDYTYSTFLNNRNLVWQVVNKTTLSDEYFLVLDMDYPKPVSNVQLSFNVIANATKHSIVEWKSQSILQVSETDYNNIHTGDCLKLAGMLSTDVRYDRYLEHQNVKWLVRSKVTEGAGFYIVLDSAYPRKYGYDNFDFIKFDRSNIILINEFYIRGNPVMESTQTYSYNSPESVSFYGTKEYNIDGKCMEKSDFEKVAGYIFNTYAGLDSTNTRMKVNIEIDQRVDIEVGNVFYITDGVITGFNNQKVMVLSKEVSLGDNGLQEQLELLTIGNYETQKITITTNTANNYTPAIAPTYSHLGGEGTTEQTTLQNQNNKIVTLYDDTEGTLTLKEIPIDTFSAITSLSTSIQPTNLTFSLTINNISASIDYRNTLLRSGAEGVILLNNEYMSYKTVGSIIGDSVTIEVTKRALGKSTASIIINGQRVQFYKVIQKVSAEGLTSNEALLGNGVTSYIQVDENKVKIVGEVEITSGNTYDSLIQYTDNTIPNGIIVVGTVTTGTATADGNVIVDVPFSYSQGTWLADSLSIYVREGGGTIIASDKNFSTSTTSTSMRFLLKPNTSYVFGVQANRTVKSGIASTAISSSNTIITVNSNYTANINGTVASTVVSNAYNGNTAFTGTAQYRDGVSPTNNASFGTITTTATTDGNIIGTIPFTYTQGINKASHILIYYREGGGTIQSTDPSIIIPASSSGSVNLILKPSITSTSKVYSFGLQALMTTASGYASFATITNSSNITMPIGNYTGLLQTNDASNYLYQNTTVKLGKNALGAGVDKDGMYVGNTGIDNTPTNYLKFNTSIGTFDLKSTGNIRFTNGSSNEINFDSGTSTNSFIKMNKGKQQLGLCSDSGGSYQGLFVGDTKLDNGKYFKYDGENLTVGKNVYFNWIDTLSYPVNQTAQTFLQKTYDQMLKGTTTYTNDLITVRSGVVGTEKAYLGNMSTIGKGFGLKIDSDSNNYFYANTVDGVKFKTNKNVNISNTTNEINFDSGTSTNSFIKMNKGKQQLGLCTDSGGSYQGLFVGDTTLTNGKYFKYDGTDLKVGKNVKFNWIDTLSDDATQSLQYLMNKTIDQMLKGTTTYTDNLITVRSSDDGTEKAYLGDMGANGFGLKIDSDVNNYFYANTVDGVKFKTNKDVNISNTTNEINFDSTTSTNSFIKVNDGSQQLGRVSVSNMPYVYSGATGTSGTYILYAIEADITSILSVGDEIKIEQSGKATTTTVITNISFYIYKTTISIGTALADTYTIGDIRKTKFNGVYFGNKKRLTGNELYKDSLGLNFSGKYFNKTAYCETTDEFLGALDTSKPILSYKVSKIPNPFYNKEINNIVLTAKDDYIISSNFVYYDSAPIVDYANIASMPTTREVTPTKYRDLSTGYIYIQDWELGDNTVHYELYDINILIYRGDALTEHDGFHFSPYTTIGGVDFTSKYYAVPITEGRTRYYISKSLLGSKETLTSEGRGIIFIIYPAYIIGYIGSHFGEDNLIIPNENIKSIKSLHSSTECTIDFANAFEGYRSSNIGMVCKNEILIENLCLKNLGSASLYMGIYPALLLLGEDSGLNNVRFINLKSQVYGSNKRNNYIRSTVVESYSSSLILGISYFLNIENLTLSIQRSLTGSLVYGCSNIKGLGIQGGDKTISTLLSSTDGYILSCHNLSNVWIQSNLYRNLFYNCININNIKVIVSNGGSVYFNSATDYYYFKNCFSMNNINFYYTDLADNNTFMYNCNYITNVIGLERKHVDFATISLRYDTNNTWNLKRDIVLDTLLPTTEYTSYSSYLIPQLLHIYIKETTIRFVTSGVDLDIDSSVAGSYGLYKFIYNNSLSQWELHQLTQDRDLSGIIKIKFSISTDNVIFSVKSNVGSRYITILAEEIK